MAMDVREFVAEDLWLLIAIVTVVAVSLVGLAGLETVAGVLSIVGFVLLVPIFLFWGEEIADWYVDESAAGESSHDHDGAESDTDDALEELKHRYANGEIDDDEFEHRLERLLGVDAALEDVFASDAVDSGSADERSSLEDRRERDERGKREPEREW